MLKIGHALLMGALHAAYDDTTGPLPPQYRSGQNDRYLTDLAVDDIEADQDFMAPQVFPRVDVQRDRGSYTVWDRGSLLKPEFRDHAYGDRPNIAHVKQDEGDYKVFHRSLERVITPNDRANARNPLQPEEDAALYLAGQARLDLDLRFIDKALRVDAGWGFHYQGVDSNPNQAADTPEFLQFDQPGATPGRLVRGRSQRMKLMTGRRPNVAVLGADVYAAMVFNEDIVDRVKYVQEGVADRNLIARYLDVDRVLVADGAYNKALEGLGDDFQYRVDPKAMLLTYAAPRPSRTQPSGGYMFVWSNLYEQFEGDQERIADTLALLRRGYDDRSGVRWVQAHTAATFNVVAPDLGMIFSDVVEQSAADW
ncbi:hypothetical protein [Deinococcus soli (ex Cha et al. 2016)]|uniref:Uncharacterized protein n=1 Tax=Deinococcus soli (ex Cha et al. 2016) TaxID=1309411 RepID=A0A0F7JIW4_9DEIO|nr:hypothetical protein [Deinococcus soli (ex Cha et al. 2016)]AKH15961.1 hypothetical protein SY84_01630 [Deinococcus soli (ex Cha et al. 2016)]